LIIVCNSCSAQYSVSDAKVRGKLVRITCKHCTTAIVVDGRQMSETEVAPHKPLSGFALPRRDESIIATMPHSVAPARAPAPVSAPRPAPVPSAFVPEDDQTMIARSRFGDDTSVHDERTVIGQIPKEALEFERMFAQRTQPPPPDTSSASSKASPVATSVPKDAPLPSFASEPPASSSEPPASSSEPPPDDDDEDDETKNVPMEGFSGSEPPTVGHKPNSDSRGLVSLAEATHPSVVRSLTARRLRVTLITLLVLAVLVALFVIQMPR
jgi:predicted Zn finger-like uncharacterized protein